MLKKIGVANIAVLAIFFLFAVFITFPLIFNLGNLTTGYGDELLIAWTHNWDIYNFLNPQKIFDIFNANIYFPYANSLAFSDVYFTDSFFALIPLLILKSPIVVNNFTIILSLTLLGFFTYLLSQNLTKNRLLSVFAGALIIFCPTFLGQFGHIQIIAIYFVPLSIYFLLKYLKSKKEIFFIGFLTSLVLQTYNSFLPGYFIVFAAISIIMFYILEDRKQIKLIFSKKNILLSLIVLALISIVAIPYFQVSKQFNYKRDIRETIHFALQPEDFLVASDQSRLQGVLSKLSFTKDLAGRGEVKPAFLGLAFSILSFLALVFFIKNFKKQNYVVKGLFVISVLGLLLSLGPFLHLQRQTIHNPFPIPLPYLIFYYLIPGFGGLRNSARFEFLFVLFIAPLIGVFLKDKLNNVKNINRNLVLTLFILVVVAEFNFPFKYYSVPQPKDFPKVYSYLLETPKSTITVEMPIYNWNVFPYSQEEFLREYYSTLNFRKTVNGASGFSPPPWQDFVLSLLINFPSEKTMDELKKIGVKLIIVHKDEYDKLYKDKLVLQGKRIPNGKTVIDYLLENKSVELVKNFGDDYVFKIK